MSPNMYKHQEKFSVLKLNNDKKHSIVAVFFVLGKGYQGL